MRDADFIPDVGQLCPTKTHKDGACCPACDHMVGKCIHPVPSPSAEQAPAGQWLRSDQRMWDLVRQQRMELLQADLITQDEYASLAVDHPAVARLESYDEIRAQLSTTREMLAKAQEMELQLRAEIQDEEKSHDVALAFLRNKYITTWEIARALAAALEEQQIRLGDLFDRHERRSYPRQESADQDRTLLLATGDIALTKYRAGLLDDRSADVGALCAEPAVIPENDEGRSK